MWQGLLSSKDKLFDDMSSTVRLKEMLAVFRKHEITTGITPLKFRLILEDLGPTFVKIGQIMSMRPDFLPREYSDALKGLQSKVHALPFQKILKLIEEEYRYSWEKIFTSIDEEPLGAASIAQVHRATLKNGEIVVLKIQRPNIYDVMAKDILLLKRVAKILNLVSEKRDVFDIEAILDEMWAIAKQEMDFLMEANHIEEFQHLNANNPSITSPKVYRSLTTARILVMEYIDGVRFDDTDSLQREGYDLFKLGVTLGENYAKQIVEDGYFHADPHPGNIRIKDGKIVWLDLGMMGRLSFRDREALKETFLALIAKSVIDMKSAVLSLGIPKEKVNHNKLYEDLDKLIMKYGNLDFGHLEMGVLTGDIIEVLRRHRITIAPGLSMLARGLLTMEGVFRECTPSMNFVEIFAKSLKLERENNFNWQEEFGKLRREGYVLLQKSFRIPEQISDILKMTMSGETKVNLDLTGSEEPLRKIDQMINKLIIGIVSSALLLGSSVICTTQMTPKIMEIPLLGVFGYLAAMFLFVHILWSILRS